MKTPTALQKASRRRVLAAAVAVPLLAWRQARAAGPGSPPRRLRLAVVPQLTPVEMYRNWQPLAEALERAGLPCDLIIHPTIAVFEREFEQGQADLAFVNPYHMVMAHRAHGYRPLLRDQRPLQGMLLVQKHSALHSLEDLRGQRISFPAPNALGASLYPRAILSSKGIPFEAYYAGNHRNAVRQVLTGDSAAVGVVRATYDMEPAEVTEALRVLYTTPDIATHPLAVHPRVPRTTQQALMSTLQALARDPQTQPLMKAVQFSEPVAADYARDYAPLGRLGLERFVVKQ